jgi:Na+/H+ antiporter NhaC
VLAWALADVCRALNTSGYLIEQVSFSFTILPLVTFLLAAGIAFSTGTSWGTMAILVPLTLSYATELSVGADPSQSQGVILAGLGAVLAGAVFGDHCSPISDTTVMSSMASGCDHIDHVRTQLPYALTVAAVAIVAGYLPAGLGYSPFLSLAVGAGILVMILLVAGRRVS